MGKVKIHRTICGEGYCFVDESGIVSLSDADRKAIEKMLSSSISSKECQLILDDLSKKANKPRGYKVTAKYKQLISARMKEGYELNDFLDVNTSKCNEWRGGDMEKYLRPETLYSTKFATYRADAVDLHGTKQTTKFVKL
jgi:uncharacterized phage protein (TIGR02220 family)